MEECLISNQRAGVRFPYGALMKRSVKVLLAVASGGLISLGSIFAHEELQAVYTRQDEILLKEAQFKASCYDGKPYLLTPEEHSLFLKEMGIDLNPELLRIKGSPTYAIRRIYLSSEIQVDHDNKCIGRFNCSSLKKYLEKRTR